MSASTSSYLNSANAFGNENGDSSRYFAQESVNPGTLGQEVGQINGATTGFSPTPTTTEEKQQQSTNGGCGTSFTSATDPKNVSVKHEVSGNFVEVTTLNDQGDVQKKWIKNDGSSITMAEDGSLILTTAKREGDANTGRCDVISHGSTRFKIGESLLIEVENKNNVVAAKDGKATGPAMSIVVYGNIDVTSVSGEVNLKGKNINLNAENELKLSAGAKISLLSGKGKGQNKEGTNSSGEKTNAQPEYGGVIDMQAGDINANALTVRRSSSMDYQIVEAEGATLSTNALANYGFESPGSFTLDVAGDYHEKIGGLKRTEILNTAQPATTIFPGQKDGWLTTIGKVPGLAMKITAESGGYNFDTSSGDVELFTKQGGWIIASDTAGSVAGVDVDKKGSDGKSLGLTPGIYLKANKKDVYIYTESGKINMGIGNVTKGAVTNGLSITQAKIEIKNSTGIYLN